ncbi:MAG: hypothetical protein K2X81_15520 [Candidatus Obscuribacterales bacterium]|nr:hypothetical protein [Candidatus Obscuribacterales bacterium]
MDFNPKNAQAEKPTETADQGTSASAALFNDFFNASREYANKVQTVTERAIALTKEPASFVGKDGGATNVKDAEESLASHYKATAITNKAKENIGSEYTRPDGTLASKIVKNGVSEQTNFDSSGIIPTEKSYYNQQSKRIARGTFNAEGYETQRTGYYDDGRTPQFITVLPDKSDPTSRLTRDVYREDGSRGKREVSFKDGFTTATQTFYAENGVTKLKETSFHPDGEPDTVTKYNAAGKIESTAKNLNHETEYRNDGSRKRDIIKFSKSGSHDRVETHYGADGETAEKKVWYRKDGTKEQQLSKGQNPGDITEEKFQADGKTLSERGYYKDDFSAVITKFDAKGTRTSETVRSKIGTAVTTNYDADGITHKNREKSRPEIYSSPAF